MKKSILTGAAIAAFLACGMMAQPGFRPRGGSGSDSTTAPDPATQAAHRVAMLTQLLTLTTAQQTQATTIFTAEITANQALATQESTARTALATAIKANSTADISTQSTALGTLFGQRTANTAQADAAFYVLLTADQKTKLDSLHSGGILGPGLGFHMPGGR